LPDDDSTEHESCRAETRDESNRDPRQAKAPTKRYVVKFPDIPDGDDVDEHAPEDAEFDEMPPLLADPSVDERKPHILLKRDATTDELLNQRSQVGRAGQAAP